MQAAQDDLIVTWVELGYRFESAVRLGPPRQDVGLLFHEILRVARTLGVPIDKARDDAHVFLEEPEKIPTATWAQCGGVLHALATGDIHSNPVGVVERGRDHTDEREGKERELKSSRHARSPQLGADLMTYSNVVVGVITRIAELARAR